MGKAYKVDTSNMIALSHILGEFKNFDRNLRKVISSKYNRDFVFQLWNVSKGKKVIGARRAKKFYDENKYVIDVINQYSDISRFINENYDCNGVSNGNLEFFYKYFLECIDELGNIRGILEKLDDLGFDKFELDESLDFTNDTYGFEPDFRRNFYITYVANGEVLPNYNSHITYRTVDSNYKMELRVIGDEISEYGREIVLNTLLFDVDSLPKMIDKEHIFDGLSKQKEEQREQISAIRNSVNLSVGVMDLEEQINSTKLIFDRLDGVQSKEELLEILSRITGDVLKLKELSSAYNTSVSESEPLLTEEVLDKEKSAYIKRREWAKVDLC